jgi:hypothetical protein
MELQNLFFAASLFFLASSILNIFQYVTICGLQDRLDSAEDALDQRRKEADQLSRELRAAKVEIEQQKTRTMRAETLPQPKPVRTSEQLFRAIEEARLGQIQPIDHVHAAVMAGHTGMMAEAMRQHEGEKKRLLAVPSDEGKKRVDEQRRLDSSKHLQQFQKAPDVVDTNPTGESWVREAMITPAEHYKCEATPVDHSPSSAYTDLNFFSPSACDTSSSPGDSGSTDSSSSSTD